MTPVEAVNLTLTAVVVILARVFLSMHGRTEHLSAIDSDSEQA